LSANIVATALVNANMPKIAALAPEIAPAKPEKFARTIAALYPAKPTPTPPMAATKMAISLDRDQAAAAMPTPAYPTYPCSFYS
jgi:hypothetical protein